EDGRKLGTARISNSPAALRAELVRAGENPGVVLEATYGWHWAADTLAAAGAEVHLAHPLEVRAYGYQRVKTDARDAANLADLLRMGRLSEARITPPEIRDLRELTRYRAQAGRAAQLLQGPGARGAGQARDRGDLLGPVRRLGQFLAGRAAAAAAVCGEGDLA